MPAFLELHDVLSELRTRDEDSLAALLSTRADLAYPAPADLTTLALRANSEMSLRLVVQRLDSSCLHTLGLAVSAAERGLGVQEALQEHVPEAGTSGSSTAHESHHSVSSRSFSSHNVSSHNAPKHCAPEHSDPETIRKNLLRLRAACLILPAQWPGAEDAGGEDSGSDDGDNGHTTDPLTLDWAVQARLPHVLSSFHAGLGSQAAQQPGAAADELAAPAQLIQHSLVRNGSLAAITATIDDVDDLLSALEQSPAQTLRTDGVGMRELKRLTALRRPGQPSRDPDIGETSWLLELAAAAGLIELDVKTDDWRPTALAPRWRGAAQHHRIQLLVSGWLLSPRSPLLLRGPHPAARIAPALSRERQRGDAPDLRRLILRVAAGLAERAAEIIPEDRARRLYHLHIPDDDQPGPDAFRGLLNQQLLHRHPIYTARVRAALPWIVREAERLGLFAAGALAPAGHALRHSLKEMAAVVESALPPQVETVVVQSDLTAVATGTLSYEAAQTLGDLAEKEGRGGVPTYRFSSASLHRGMERGWTSDTIRQWLTQHSLTELPSTLTTLIDDAARSFRAVRVGTAGAWIQVPDEQTRELLLQDPRMQGLGAFALADDVVITRGTAGEVAPELRRLGVKTAAEPGAEARAGSESAATAAETGPRSHAWTLPASPWQSTPVRTLGITEEDPDLAHIAELARTLRSPEDGRPGDSRARTSGGSGSSRPHDTPPQDAPQNSAEHTQPAAGGEVAEGAGRPGSGHHAPETDMVGTLRAAVAGRRRMRITRVTGHGEASTVVGVPTAVNAGRVRVRLSEKDDDVVMLLHRIGTVEDAPAQGSATSSAANS